MSVSPTAEHKPKNNLQQPSMDLTYPQLLHFYDNHHPNVEKNQALLTLPEKNYKNIYYATKMEY